MPQPSAADIRLMVAAGEIAKQVHTQLEHQGASPEEVWVVLALAARVSERAVIEADRHFQDLRSYAVARERLNHLISISDATCDGVEEKMAREDGAPEVVRS